MNLEHKETSINLVISTVTPAEKTNNPIGMVWLAAEHPGQAGCLGELGKYLSEKGVAIVTLGKDEGEKRFAQIFPQKQAVAETPKPEWLLCGGETETIQLAALARAKAKNDQVRVGLVEDYPGNLEKVITKMQEQKLAAPELILTTTYSGAIDCHRQFRDYLKNTLIVPIGQPAFDALAGEKTAELRNNIRSELAIPMQAKVLTYIGMPKEDYEAKGWRKKINGQEFSDLNSATLDHLSEAIERLAREKPEEQFVLIYRPHPREKGSVEHPVLNKIKEINNVRLIIYGINKKVVFDSKRPDNQTVHETRPVCAASDVVATVISTVGQETALAGGRPSAKSSISAIPLHVLFPEAIEVKNAASKMLVIDIGASEVSYNPDDLYQDLNKALFVSQEAEIIHQGEKKLAREYRFKGVNPAARRAYFWLKAVSLGRKEKLKKVVNRIFETASA